MEGVKVKVEEESTAATTGGGGAGGGGPLSSASSSSPQPMEGLHEVGPPPFLTKTYEMVEDPSTDAVISWNKAKNSFIGFRKVDPDRWEFANEGFLGGQKHLLKTIKRRRHTMQVAAHQAGGSCAELEYYGMDEELERLRRDRNLLLTDIMKLKQQQQSSRQLVMAMEERLENTERKQQQMLSFLAKAFKNPMFIQQYLDKHTNGKKNIKIGQKRRIAMSPSVENLQEVMTVSMGSSQPSSYARDEQEELMDTQLKVESFFSAAMEDESSSDLKSLSASDIWEFLKDDLIAGDEAEDIEVEELVAKTPDWGEDLQDIVDQLGFP